jgi:hypothetical protein
MSLGPKMVITSAINNKRPTRNKQDFPLPRTRQPKNEQEEEEGAKYLKSNSHKIIGLA